MDELHAIDERGYCMLREQYTPSEVAHLRQEMNDAFARDTSEAVRPSAAGHVFAARNVLTIWPRAMEIWRRPAICAVLIDVLGAGFGLVRGLYFDKPPEQTWSLPWHKDLTISVREHRKPSGAFSKPTVKVGVPHVEAPVEVLERMLTLRIHLDPATADNGALVVLPGSHRNGKAMDKVDAAATVVDAEPGDVLVIRPLVSHCSGSSKDGTQQHRRVLHLEFAADRDLPDGFEWFHFTPSEVS